MYRYQVHQNINKLYKQIKKGLEVAPLQREKRMRSSNDPTHRNTVDLTRLSVSTPCEQALSDIYLRKCNLLMHMVEQSTGEDVLTKIIKEIYHDTRSDKQEKG